MDRLYRSKVNLFIMGDINIDYLNKTAVAYKSLAYFERSNQLNQFISETTRNTNKTNTLLDIIMTDDINVGKSGTLDLMLSDHQALYVVKKKARELRNSASFMGRSYNTFDFTAFRDRLAKIDVKELYSKSDPEEIWLLILNHILDDLDVHCPTRRFNIRNYKPDWANDQLLEQIRDRDYFYKKAKRSKLEEDWNTAKHLRNIVNRNIRQAKAEYVIGKLEQCKGDSS